MDPKKWPILAQILIGLGCIGGLRGVFFGIMQTAILDLLFGVLQLFIFWNLYKFRPWSIKAVTILFSLNIFSAVYLILIGAPIMTGLVIIALNGFIIYYFNSLKIKALFL